LSYKHIAEALSLLSCEKPSQLILFCRHVHDVIGVIDVVGKFIVDKLIHDYSERVNIAFTGKRLSFSWQYLGRTVRQSIAWLVIYIISIVTLVAFAYVMMVWLSKIYKFYYPVEIDHDVCGLEIKMHYLGLRNVAQTLDNRIQKVYFWEKRQWFFMVFCERFEILERHKV